MTPKNGYSLWGLGICDIDLLRKRLPTAKTKEKLRIRLFNLDIGIFQIATAMFEKIFAWYFLKKLLLELIII